MSPEPIDLQALFSEICPDAAELVVPGPGQSPGVVRPVSIEAALRLIRCLRQAMLSWTIGPLDPGIVPRLPVVVIDVGRLTRVGSVQPRSGLVTVEGGVRPETLARLLRGEGWHADPLPQRVLLGRALVSRWGRLRHPGRTDGSLAERVVSLGVILPDGSLLHTPLAPRRATGPDLAALLLGSRGTLGVVVSATLRIDRLPEESVLLGYRLAGGEQAQAAARRLLQATGLPLHALATQQDALALRLEGSAAMVQAARLPVRRLLASFDARPAEPDPGLLEPAPPPLATPQPEVALLGQRLRKALDPADLLRTQDEIG